MKYITLQKTKVQYEIVRNKRAKRMKLSILHNGNIIVTVPPRFSAISAEKFIREQSEWILTKMEYFAKFKEKKFLKISRKDYIKYKESARKLAHERIEHFNEIYNFKYNRIFIRKQKTIWGSCSQNGNINLNYIIALVPRRIADYIIVHEMCHLWEFNHSPKFWKLVEKAIPNYKKIQKEVNDIYFL